MLFLTVCLKNPFCIFEILHIKQSVMISLILAVSFFMGCGSFSFCRFASSFISGRWSVLHLWIAFYSICYILYLTNTGNLMFVCVSNSRIIISVIVYFLIASLLQCLFFFLYSLMISNDCSISAMQF